MAFTNSNYSAVVQVTTQAAPNVQLGTPTNLVATALTPSPTDTTAKVQLNWVSNSASNEVGFGVERAPTPTGTFVQIATVGRNVTTYTDSTLAFSTNYSFRVRALA